MERNKRTVTTKALSTEQKMNLASDGSSKTFSLENFAKRALSIN
jgi:hypothetical protein